MGVLSQYRTDRLIERLLSGGEINGPAARPLLHKLRRDPGEAIPALIGRLEHADEETYRDLVVALYKLLDEDTLEHFTAALHTDRTRTLIGLAKVLRTSRRFNPNRLIPLFQEPEVPKSTLIRILSEHQRRLNAELLLRYASRREVADHNALFRVIEAIADASLVPHLINRADAADASVRSHVLQLLARFPSRQVEEVLERHLADDSKAVRLAAIEGLAATDVHPSIAALARLLRDPDLAIQSRAIDAVIRLRDPETMTHLIPVLQDESEYVRRAGVEVLNEIADTSLVSELLNVLRDEDWWVRERAADALARIGGPRVVDAMLELIGNDDEFIRRTAIEVINASRDPRAYEHLLRALGDPDWWVKERAIDAIAALGATDAVPALRRELEHDSRARPTLLRALAALGDASVVPDVVERLGDPDMNVRVEALRALESLTEQEVAASVIARIEAALEDAPAEFRDQARVVMANIRARSASEPSAAEDETAPATATLIARPGEAPQRLVPGTRLDLPGLLPGTVLDSRYRFVEGIGQGAFGTVMRFEDTTVNEEIILKFLNEQVAEDERARHRFVRELRFARRVTHPNVIRIYDFLRIGGLYAISMEHFPGFPLTRELLQGQAMRLDRALRLIREITFGMASAHRSGVVHRDLKPANILMNHADQVKVVDFGIAAAAFGGNEDTELTRTGDFVGTPAYTSPEQVRGEQVDARTDIYSLGVVMYRMLSGRLPYQDKERKALLLHHLQGRPPAVEKLNPELPAALAAVVRRAMAVNPHDRYQSMTDLRRDLEQCMG